MSSISAAAARLLALALVLAPALTLAQVSRPAPGTQTTLSVTGTTGNTLVIDTTTLVVDATNHRVGIGSSAPTRKLLVVDTATDPSGRTAMAFTNTVTLTTNNASTMIGLSGGMTVDQAASNLTTAQGVRTLDLQATASGVSGTVTDAMGVRSAIVNSGAGTLTNGYGYWSQPSNSGGGTFTNWYAYYAPATTVGSTLRTGFRGALAANAAAWNLYMDGTAQNYLLGNVGIGSGKTAPAVALDVAGTINSTGYFTVPPTTQTIGAGNTVAADSCGGFKAVTAAGAVSTDTTNTFTAPAAGNTGCVLYVCNIGVTHTITLDHNAKFFTLAGGDLALAANTCVIVLQDGTEWRQVTGLLTAS